MADPVPTPVPTPVSTPKPELKHEIRTSTTAELGVISLEKKDFMYRGNIFSVQVGQRFTDPGSIYILHCGDVKVRPIVESDLKATLGKKG